MPAKGITRRITRKQALSYELTSPNPIGVTAIAAVMNRSRRGKVRSKKKSSEYDRRYKQTRDILDARQGGGMLRMRKMRRRVRRNSPASELLAREPWLGTQSVKAPRKKRRSAAQKAALAKAQRASMKKRLGKKYGRFTSLKAKVGQRTLPTYAYKGKKGKAKKIPLWAILGQKSKKSFERHVASDEKLARRVVKAKKRREKKSASLLLHGDMFTPNRRKKRSSRRTISYANWSKSMATPNKRKKRATGAKKASRKRRTPAQRRATAKMLAKRWGKSIRPRKAWKNKRKAAANPRRRRTVAKRRASRKAVSNPRRKKRSVVARMAPKRRKARKVSHKRKAHRNFMYNANRKRRTHTKRRRHASANFMYNANRKRRTRRHRRHFVMNPPSLPNRRHHRRYRRNPDVLSQIKSVFASAAVVAVGFLGHRALTYVVSEKLLSTIPTFQTGAAAEWRGTISGLLVAAVGIPVVAKFAPKQAAQLGAGIAVSFIHQAIITGLKKAGQAEIAGYLAAYPDSEGRAFYSMKGYGSYELMPQNGYGSYELMPASGFGQITQAAAGYGASPMITQAAAGMGAGYDYYQQYSGMGSPITQAAAGMGEYVAQNLQGLGEYEAVQGYGGLGAAHMIHEGIHPNTHSAERALTVAEAAAGVGGFGDIPLESTLTPEMIAAPILDAPAGSRAGILQGGDGIFG